MEARGLASAIILLMLRYNFSCAQTSDTEGGGTGREIFVSLSQLPAIWTSF